VGESKDYPNKLTKRFSRIFLALGVMFVSLHATAQQSSSAAVETFEPVFDVGVEMRPRVGLYGITELMMAALEADIPRAKQLLDAGADINETDDSRSTPLMWAVHSGDVNIVNFFIAEGANVRAKAYQGATALMNALTGKHEASAVALINAGADANGRGNSARNFLEDAAESGMTDVVDALIRNGTNLDSYGHSALYLAVSRGHKDTAIRLLDAGVDANSNTTRLEHTLLYMASAVGELELAELLISKGADASQPSDYGSPLYPAATGGHTAVAELLIENGAVPTAKIVLAATQKGNGETAVALMNQLDLEKTEVVEIESLLTAADELGNDEFTRLLLNSASARSVIDEAEQAAAAIRQAASREHSRLLFAQQAEDHCVIGVWDSRSDALTELANIAKCPDEIFVSKNNRSAFIVDDTSIRIVSIDKSAADLEVALPDLDYLAWLDQMEPRPDQNPDYLPSMTGMRPNRISQLDDGSLALVLSLWMPADDEFHYLFRYDDGQWSMIEGQWCHRWGCDKALGPLTSKSSRDWPESRMIWHAALKFNPFLSRQSVEMVDLEYESYQGTIHRRTFEIDGVSSALSVYTSPSEHSDTSHTFGINLIIDGSTPKELSGNQCLTSIVGRYILVYEFFQGRFEVTDLGTSATVISDLKTALWLD
jgi:ankyrin repeat protein